MPGGTTKLLLSQSLADQPLIRSQDSRKHSQHLNLAVEAEVVVATEFAEAAHDSQLSQHGSHLRPLSQQRLQRKTMELTKMMRTTPSGTRATLKRILATS